MRFAATGDAFIVQRVPRDEAFHELVSLLSTAEARFSNLETVIRRDEGFPSAQSGGTWASSEPEVLDDLRDYGFNLIARANNHTLDYSYGGLAATEKHLGKFVHAGAGSDLAGAGAARFLETSGGRVALIAATSSFHESWRAGRERPGVNPLRFRMIYRVAPERLTALRAAADACGINAIHDSRVKDGFITPDPAGTLRVGSHLFAAAEDGRERESSAPHAGDLARIVEEIQDAASHAKQVLVSIHSHEIGDGQKNRPADFLTAFARACIDAGAQAVIGHGPHILRGVEIYRGRPIFYSLGNFIFQNELVRWLPADFYEQYGVDLSLNADDALNARSAGGTRGLAVHPEVWHSVVARWTMADGGLTELTLHPVSLGFGQQKETRGVPRLSRDLAPLEEIQDLSEPFGTKFHIKNHTLIWKP